MAPRRTDVQIVIDMLRQQPSNQASPRRLAELLGWDLTNVQRVTSKANQDGGDAIHIGRGGVIQHRGTERAANGLYSDIARIIADYWGPRALGLRNITPIHTARGGSRGEGVWTHPDLVVAADPKRRNGQSEPRRLHAIEVETKAGFDLRSVYQAHAQGRGADYSWVFGSKKPEVSPKDWERVVWTAKDLGVGLVTFAQPGSFGTWITHGEAAHQEPTPDERAQFIERAVGKTLQAEHGL